MNVINRYVETPAADPDAPGAFRFAEPGKLAGVLTDAGASDVGECAGLWGGEEGLD